MTRQYHKGLVLQLDQYHAPNWQDLWAEAAGAHGRGIPASRHLLPVAQWDDI